MNAIEKWLAQPSSIEQLKHHAPEGFSVDRAKRSVLALLHNDSIQGGNLSRCSPASLVFAMVQASALGLELGTGDAYVIPYKQQATLSIGYRGMIKLGKRSGEITHIKAEVVYDGEEFRVWSDERGEHLQHVPTFPRSSEDIVAVYCCIVCHDGFRDYEYMDAGEIDAVKAASESKMGGRTSPAWRQWYGEMAKKAVIRRALKRYTLAPEVERVFEHEDRIIYTTAEVVSGPERTMALNRRLQLVTDEEPAASEAEITAAPSAEPDEAPAPPAESDDTPPTSDEATQGASEGIARSLGQLLKGIDGEHVVAFKAMIIAADEPTQDEWMQALREADDRNALIAEWGER